MRLAQSNTTFGIRPTENVAEEDVLFECLEIMDRYLLHPFQSYGRSGVFGRERD